MRTQRVITFLVAAVLLLGPPLLGVWIRGVPVAQFTEFPPLTIHRTPAEFSWIAAAIIFVFQLPLWIPVAAVLRQICRSWNMKPATWDFPGWGWIALAWTGTWWIIAWTRFPCFAAIQHHTFTPLWLGYIAIVNAVTFARAGRCMMTHARSRLLILFVVSALFWWFFEYLNRFVQNWFYTGIEDFGRFEYFVFASLAFSTVLPAILGTAGMIDSFLPQSVQLRIFSHAATISAAHVRSTKIGAAAGLLLASVALAGIGIWPDYFFPFLWLAPLFILTLLRAIRGEATIFADAMRGDWRRLAVLSLSALICGLFWEMWNFHSLAKWIYLVPFVGVWKVFEMPLLGFAGYLPFGWEAAVIADALGRKDRCESN